MASQPAIKNGVGMNSLFNRTAPPLTPVPEPPAVEEPPAPVAEPEPPEVQEPVEIPPAAQVAPLADEDPLADLDRLHTPAPLTPAVRRRRRRQETLVRADLRLPDNVAQRAKNLTRPVRTGSQRTLGAAFVLQSYVRVMDELGLDIDMQGLEAGMEDEMVDRVRQALEQWAGR